MIDRLHLSIDPLAPLEPEFQRLLTAVPPRRPKRSYYREFRDLRPTLPLNYYTDGIYTSSNKLELIEVGHLSAAQIWEIMNQVVLDDPLTLAIQRVDLAVDVPVMTATWFWHHAWIRNKRFHQVWNSAEDPGTVYYGHRNLIRAYDKLAHLERLADAGELSHANAQLLALYRSAGCPWTRVERQLTDGKIPKEINSLGRLFRNVAEFEPFKSVELFGGGAPDPSEEDCKGLAYFTGLGLRSYAKTHGMQRLVARLNLNGGHAQAQLRRFAIFLPPSPDEFEPPDLGALFEASVSQQIGEFYHHDGLHPATQIDEGRDCSSTVQ